MKEPTMRRSKTPSRPPSVEPGPPPVIKRPDGFYRLDQRTGKKFGPYATLDDALADLQNETAYGEEIEPGESLQEAEEELGIADWIDPDTGEPAEGPGPHLEDH